MAKGNISETELNNAKNNILSVIDTINDYPDRIIDSYLLMALLKLDDLKTRKQK